MGETALSIAMVFSHVEHVYWAYYVFMRHSIHVACVCLCDSILICYNVPLHNVMSHADGGARESAKTAGRPAGALLQVSTSFHAAMHQL